MIAWLVGAALAVSPVAIVVSDDVPAYEDPAVAAQRLIGDRGAIYRLHGREADGAAVGARLAADPPEVVLAFGAKAAWIARKAIPDTPLVYASIRDPARYGVVGAQTTGVEMGVAPETFLSQFAAFFPADRSIGLVLGPGTSTEQESALTRAGAEVGVGLIPIRVGGVSDVRRALHRAPPLDALWLVPDVDLLAPTTWRTLIEESQRRKVPLLVDTAVLVRAGGAFAVVPDPQAIATAAVGQVERVLSGELPQNLAIVTAEGRLVVVNNAALDSIGAEFDPLLRDFVDVFLQ